MERNQATKFLREELDKYSLQSWSIRLSTNPNDNFLGICLGKDKCIMLNAHHIGIHPTEDVINTILHEVAHAIVGTIHQHDEVWAAKAKEIGCTNTLPCSHLSLSPAIIDAIRLGQSVKITFEEEHHVIRRPKYEITLQDKCPDCGKVAKERWTVETTNKNGDTVKLITLECFHVITKVIPRGTKFEELVSNWWKPEIAACKHKWTKTQCDNCGEYRLMKFQVEACFFAEGAMGSSKGVGLFHDTGLGKTVMGLGYIHFHPARTLYVVKSAIKFQWSKQITKWLGPKFMAQIIETSRDYVFPNLNSYIISYDLLKRFNKEKLAELDIKYVVLDECQQISNPDSNRTQQLRKLVNNQDIKVIALSATPWKNRGSEFFPILNILNPTKFWSYQHFIDTWIEYYWHGDKRKMGGIKNVAKFKEYVGDFIIRREYNEVMDEFPEVNRMKLNMQMDNILQEQYDDAEDDFVNWYNQFIIDGTEGQVNSIQILAQLARARHIVGLAKIPATVGFIEEFIDTTDRSIVVFVHHKDVGIHLLQELKRVLPSNVVVESLTSANTDEEKNKIAERFGIRQTVLVASTLACGEGVDGLQKGCDSILHERQWNPANEDQATPGRFRRIGQMSKSVNITCVEADGTCDQDLDGIVEQKRLSFHQTMNKGEAPSWRQDDIAKELANRIIEKHKLKNKGKTPKSTVKPVVSSLMENINYEIQ